MFSNLGYAVLTWRRLSPKATLLLVSTMRCISDFKISKTKAYRFYATQYRSASLRAPATLYIVIRINHLFKSTSKLVLHCEQASFWSKSSNWLRKPDATKLHGQRLYIRASFASSFWSRFEGALKALYCTHYFRIYKTVLRKTILWATCFKSPWMSFLKRKGKST